MKALTISELVRLAYGNAKLKGFHDYSGGQPNINEKLMLIVSELSEAMEELRSGCSPNETRTNIGKPEGFPIELADAVIRIADLCGLLGIDLEHAIAIKHAFNTTRPRKHGKAF